MKTAKSLRVRVVVLREENRWVAQCLEYDIAAQSNTLKGLQYAFEKAFFAQIAANVCAKKQPLEDVPQAPRLYHKLFAEAIPLAKTKPMRPPKPLKPQIARAATQEMRIAA